jgi:hypothetical protein
MPEAQEQVPTLELKVHSPVGNPAMNGIRTYLRAIACAQFETLENILVLHYFMECWMCPYLLAWDKVDREPHCPGYLGECLALDGADVERTLLALQGMRVLNRGRFGWAPNPFWKDWRHADGTRRIAYERYAYVLGES